jgi:hypothetical protein
MRKKEPIIGAPEEAGPISGGFGGRGASTSPFKLQPQGRPVYEIWSRSQGKKVGEVTTREGATRAVDQRDIQYGANDHYWKKAGQ